VDQSQVGHLPKGRHSIRLLGRARASLRTTPPHHHRPGFQLQQSQFWEYCENNRIDVQYVSVTHPRANRQVKRANGMLLDALKKLLHDAANTKGGKWIKELPNALQRLRTHPTKPTWQ
jgi:hypothetical protein